MNPRGHFRRWLTGLAFLLPNIAGFCAFTLIPLVMSFAMAFTNWDILRHNLFRHDPLRFVGVANFARLFADADFWIGFGNTLFFLLGLPFAIAGSLIAALLLTRVARGRVAAGPLLAVATVVLVASLAVLVIGGFSRNGVLGLFGLMAAGVLAAGLLTGGTAYRTLFYLPHFTAGVATFVLWKKLYNPHTGPFNTALAPLLDGVSAVIRAWPGVFTYGLPALCGCAAVAIVLWQESRLRRRWEDGEAGEAAVVTGALTLALPLACFLRWQGWSLGLALAAAAVAAALLVAVTVRRPRPWGKARSADAGLSSELSLALGRRRPGRRSSCNSSAGTDPSNRPRGSTPKTLRTENRCLADQGFSESIVLPKIDD